MNKQQELQVLDEMVKRLGPDSYLGPWLTEVRAEVAADLSRDYQPSALPSKSAKQAVSILNFAEEQAAEFKARTERRAAETLATAERRAAEIVGAAARNLQTALKSLGA